MRYFDDSAREAALLHPDTVPDTKPSISEISPPDDTSDETGGISDDGDGNEDGATDDTWDDDGDGSSLDATELLSVPRQAVSVNAASNAAATPMHPYFFTDKLPFLSGRAEAPPDFCAAEPTVASLSIPHCADFMLSAIFSVNCQP